MRLLPTELAVVRFVATLWCAEPHANLVAGFGVVFDTQLVAASDMPMQRIARRFRFEHAGITGINHGFQLFYRRIFATS